MANDLAFLDSQRILEPSLNDQVGFDFQGLRRSFKEDQRHPASKMVAHFGRVWVYDVALCIYADLKAGRTRQAGYQAGRLMQLALREEEMGFKGMCHFSYNTREDTFIDARGPTGANAWCLNAAYAYVLATGDRALLQWANRMVREYLFPMQVMDPADPRSGLIRAGLHNADETARGDEMGYKVYEGDLNHRYEHVILEHCADAAGTFRLACRANRRLAPAERGLPEELIHRHDLLMQGMRRAFWVKDHFVSALDEKGQVYRGTDGAPSVAVDNNTWSAHVMLPYDLEMARQSVRYVERTFAVKSPPAEVEDTLGGSDPKGLNGLFYFNASFEDPFVRIPSEHQVRLERMFQPEAAFGFVLFLAGVADCVPDAEEAGRLRARAQQLYEHTVRLQGMYGAPGSPYASANIPGIFSTLHSVTTAASGVVTKAILGGVPGDDFIGVLPPAEFTVAGKPPLKSAS